MISLCSLLLLACPLPIHAEESIAIVVQEQELVMEEPVLLQEGRVFVPVRHLTEQLGGEIRWNEEDQSVVITSSYGDTILFLIGRPEVQFNGRAYVMDVAPFLLEGRSYIPIRHAAEFLHAAVSWDEAAGTVHVAEVPLYTVAEGDSLTAIGEKFGTTEELLLERNGLESEAELESGEAIKVAIPGIMMEKLESAAEERIIQETAAEETVVETADATAAEREEEDWTQHPDFMLLAKIIQVEAGYESYEGQLAVGSVVMNRVADERFPDTISDVIYHPGQFPPAHNGKLDASMPGEYALKAAEEALRGVNNVEGALFFYNPRVTSGPYWESLTLIQEIGNHRFMQ